MGNSLSKQVHSLQPGRVRAALYVRVSTQEQADRWGLPAQRRVLHELAERRGWDGVLYDEGGASAETLVGRPVMQRLLADVAGGRIDLVAVVEIERLCRASDLRDWAAISTTLRDAGVPVATPERIFNLDTAEDDFEADLRGILSKREKRKLLERTQRGLREAKDAGRFAGGRPPTGYRYDHATKKVVPDPDTVPLVRRIFESELTPWRLSRELRREGIHLPYATIRRMRTLPFYLGLRPNSEGKLIQADWPAIINKELWEKQQSHPQSSARRSSRSPGPAFLLSGIARCGSCGNPAIGTPIKPSKAGTPLHVYKCFHQSHCGQISGWLVDMLVVDALQQYARDPARLKKRYREAIDALRENQDPITYREELQAKALDLEDREARLLDAVESGTLPNHLVKKRLREIEAEKDDLQREHEAFNAAETIPSVSDLQVILDLAEDIDKAESHRDLLKRLAIAVEVDWKERSMVVRWRFGGESRYRVPKLKGGPGRSVERFMEIARERRFEYRA